MKKMAMALAATLTMAVSCLPAMAATSQPNIWYDPEWEGVFHNSHSIHVHQPIHQQHHGLTITA